MNTNAKLCNSCGFGSQGDRCVKCGNNFARIQAHVCTSCAVKYRNRCIKCGSMI